MSNFPIKEFGKAIRAVLKSTDDAGKKKAKDNLNAALKVARKRWADGDEDGARQILGKMQAGASKKTAKKAKVAKAKPADKAPKAVASKTPMLDRIAEGARPMDEVLKGDADTKDVALAAIAKRTPAPKAAKKVEDTDFYQPSDKIDEAREQALDSIADSGPKRSASERLEEAKKRGAEKGGPDEEDWRVEELPDMPDQDDASGWLAALKRAELADPVIRQNIIRNWNRKFNYVVGKGEYSIDELVKAQQENVRRRGRNLKAMNNREFKEFMDDLRNPKETPSGYTSKDERARRLLGGADDAKDYESKQDMKKRADAIVAGRRMREEMSQDLTSYKYSGREKAAIKQENRRRRRFGKRQVDRNPMTRQETDQFVQKLRNPTRKKTVSSMPKLEEKNLPAAKPREAKMRDVEDVKAENKYIESLNDERISRGKKRLSPEAEQEQRRRFRQEKFLEDKRPVPTRKRVKKRKTTAEATGDPTQRITPARRETVREMGRRARERGQGKSAMQDPSFRRYTAGITPGDRDDLMRDWLDGWNT